MKIRYERGYDKTSFLTFFSYLVLREGILQTAASLIPYFVKNKLLSRNALQQQLLFQQTLFL